MKEKLSGIMCTLLLLSMLTVAVNVELTTGNTTITVPDDYPTIQEAINAAKGGDTIYVGNGTYRESININKPLKIEGQSKENTTIDCSEVPKGQIVVISSSDVSLCGFTIMNPHYSPRFGIQIGELGKPCLKNIAINKTRIRNCDFAIFIYNASDIIIADNDFEENSVVGIEGTLSSDIRIQIVRNTMTLLERVSGSTGIDVSNSKNSIFGHNKITNINVGIHTSEDSWSTYVHNELYKCRTGISVDMGENNTISYNEMQDNELCISLEKASNNIVSNNEIFNNFEGTGIGIRFGGNNTIAHNNINNTQSGISVSSSNYNSIRNNFIYNCSKEACKLKDSSFNTIEANTICSCYCGTSADVNSRNNTICHNDFLENEIQAYEGGTNYWDNGSLEGGNYWSDYEGEDQNGDGFGNTLTPHFRDRYPLIIPRGSVPILWKQKRYDCTVLGNFLTVSRLHLDHQSKQLGFNIIGYGYCNLIVPRDLLDGAFQILVNDTTMDIYSLTWNDTHTSIHLTYRSSITCNVKVIAQVKLKGDLNGDGKVDILDVSIIARHWGEEL